ncbi:MAG TPA: cupin domain-containing protein [Micromonosporaceae bacterium]|nr:cupin domain-containing protein [Micromonosporaceae bacterium]
MDAFSRWELPGPGQFGFRPVIGPAARMARTMLAVGRLPAGDRRPMHLHHGEEVLMVVEGTLTARVGDQRRSCGPGDVIAVPAETWHGIEVHTETVLAVLTERGMGNVYPVRDPDGSRRQVEVYRRDVPWSAEPPPGLGWTSDEELARVMANIDDEV